LDILENEIIRVTVIDASAEFDLAKSHIRFEQIRGGFFSFWGLDLPTHRFEPLQPVFSKQVIILALKEFEECHTGAAVVAVIVERQSFLVDIPPLL
jgi:hypothetical protein